MFDVIEDVFVAMYIQSRCSKCSVEELVETGLVAIGAPRIEKDMIFKIEVESDELLEHSCGKKRTPRQLGWVERLVRQANRRLDEGVFSALTRIANHLRQSEVATYRECESDIAILEKMLQRYSKWQGDQYELDIELLLDVEKGTAG